MIDGVGLTQDQFFRAAWIVNGYILGYVVAMPLMGRVADTYGLGRVFAAGPAAFCAGSAWVALSQDLTMLSIARARAGGRRRRRRPVAMAIVRRARRRSDGPSAWARWRRRRRPAG